MFIYKKPSKNLLLFLHPAVDIFHNKFAFTM